MGDDVLGRFLKDTLTSQGVDTSEMMLTDEARTGVVFVTLDEKGERNFSFYIDPSADRFLSKEDVKPALFSTNRILHFGSISLISEPSKSATIEAVKQAKEQNLIVSYDPNLRLGLWPTEAQAKETILSIMSEADVVKISEEELEFLTGESDLDRGIEKLASYQIPVLLVTFGGGRKLSSSQWPNGPCTSNENTNRRYNGCR